MPRGIPRAGFRKTKNYVSKINSVAEVIPESRFTINERFEFVGDMVKMLANNEQSSIIVTGPGGLGKISINANLN